MGGRNHNLQRTAQLYLISRTRSRSRINSLVRNFNCENLCIPNFAGEVATQTWCAAVRWVAVMNMYAQRRGARAQGVRVNTCSTVPVSIYLQPFQSRSQSLKPISSFDRYFATGLLFPTLFFVSLRQALRLIAGMGRKAKRGQ